MAERRRRTTSSRFAVAANTFLATLDPNQRQSVLFAIDDAQQRAHWSNLPTAGMVRRAGLCMRELTTTQRTAAFALVASVLSKRGFEKVQQFMEADGVLKRNEGNSAMSGEDLDYISILGAPFGGHQLAVNVTIAGERGVLTPA
ncbi:conserved exported hypothetical protein [Candidatus Sulfopaludibacter sp. SbA3]|nr:conserved exported hypothetical protein [Candidatus Sulfopaludibacter sp. SbA3]